MPVPEIVNKSIQILLVSTADNPFSFRDYLVGNLRHCRNDDCDFITFLTGLFDEINDFRDTVCIANRSSTEFHYEPHLIGNTFG